MSEWKPLKIIDVRINKSTDTKIRIKCESELIWSVNNNFSSHKRNTPRSILFMIIEIIELSCSFYNNGNCTLRLISIRWFSNRERKRTKHTDLLWEDEHGYACTIFAVEEDLFGFIHGRLKSLDLCDVVSLKRMITITI